MPFAKLKRRFAYAKQLILPALLLTEYLAHVSLLTGHAAGLLQAGICLFACVRRNSYPRLLITMLPLYLAGLWLAVGSLLLTDFGRFLMPGSYLLYLKFIILNLVFRQITPDVEKNGQWLFSSIFYGLGGGVVFLLATYGYDRVQSGAMAYTNLLPGSLTEICTLLSLLLVSVTLFHNNIIQVGINLVLAVLVGWLASSVLLCTCSLIVAIHTVIRRGWVSPVKVIGLLIIICGGVYLQFNDQLVSSMAPRWMAIHDTIGYLTTLPDVLFGGGVHSYVWHYGNAIIEGAHQPYPGLINSIAHNDFINVYLAAGLSGLAILLLLVFGVARRLGFSIFAIVLIIVAGFPIEQNFSAIVLAWVLSYKLAGKLNDNDWLRLFHKYLMRGVFGFVLIVLTLSYIGKARLNNALATQEVNFDRWSNYARYDLQSLNDLYFRAAEVSSTDSILRIAKRYLDLSGAYYTYLYVGDEYFRRFEYVQANKAYLIARKIKPDYAYPLYKLFFCQLNLGNISEAISICEILASQNEYHHGLYNGIFIDEIQQAINLTVY